VNYYLNHKSRHVALIELDDDTKKVIGIETVFNEAEMPVKLDGKNLVLDCGKLDRWIENRGIPNSRENIAERLKTLNVKTTKDLSVMSYGLNLTDHYWISKQHDDKSWEALNFFDNDFSEDVGRVLFENAGIREAEVLSPDCTLNGNLEKMWRIIDTKRMLVKGGNNIDRAEPFNEKLASAIMDRLGIDHVRYDLFSQSNKTYCICECMVDRDHEFINAYYVYNHKADDRTEGKYRDYVRILEQNGVPDARDAVDKMIALDFLIANRDRHHGNFGIIRNANTLRWEKAAPLFDNGTSMWTGIHESLIRFDKTDNRSFGNTNEEIVLNMGRADFFEVKKLSDIGTVYHDLLLQNKLIPKEKRIALCGALENRVRQFDEIVHSKRLEQKKEHKRGGVKR
jgi:hypothetical protein